MTSLSIGPSVPIICNVRERTTERRPILEEQFAYLLDHWSTCGDTYWRCPECARLRRIENELMEPWK